VWLASARVVGWRVTSACETFVSAPIGIEDQNGCSPEKNRATPPSLSPSSSPRTSLSTGSWDLGSHGDNLAHLVDEVNRQARVLASQTHRRKSGSRGHTHSRSHGNLVDLQSEEDGEELGVKEKLKYPSDCAIDSTYYQMLQDKDQVLKELQHMVRYSQDDTTPRNSHGITLDHAPVTGELETSLSEPDLHKSE